MRDVIYLVYDDHNGNLYNHADFIGTITAHGCGCKAYIKNGVCADCRREFWMQEVDDS